LGFSALGFEDLGFEDLGFGTLDFGALDFDEFGLAGGRAGLVFADFLGRD
jgi:hypothetical protein